MFKILDLMIALYSREKFYTFPLDKTSSHSNFLDMPSIQCQFSTSSVSVLDSDFFSHLGKNNHHHDNEILRKFCLCFTKVNIKLFLSSVNTELTSKFESLLNNIRI